jgi:predicted dinucleotide-utilizing enzyme
MNMTEESMRFLEEHIPDLADAAVKQAYWQALATGSSVLVSEEGALVEIFPDGTRKVLKQLELQTAVTSGQRLELS